MTPHADVAVLVAEPTTAPQSEVTRETIDRLRSVVLPEVLAGSPARAHVGGQVAVFADLGHRVQDRLPWFIAAVVLLSFVLLMVMFRSLLVPLKAAVMNLLSVSAAYGVLVMVFQWGWGADLIGLESTVPILSFIPLFMFAILFGLSMDYEVFLLSRVREEYLRTGDNDEAVVRGLAGTARTITSAALIMVAVFGGFVLGADPLVKMMGLGLATAIALDATIVRLVLVPATMTLLGHANWWLPAWLDRLLPGSRDPTSPGSLSAAPTRWRLAHVTGRRDVDASRTHYSTGLARENRTSSMSRRACTRRSTMSSIRCSSRSSRSASRRRPMRASERLVYWSSCWTTGSPSAPSAASSLRCLSSSCRTRSTTVSPLPSSAAVVVESLDGCVEGVLLGELELLGDRGVDWQPREPHDRRQQQRLEEGQHDDAAGDQHDEVPVGERGSGVQRVRHGEDRGERHRAAEPGHRADGALPRPGPGAAAGPAGGRGAGSGRAWCRATPTAPRSRPR